MAVNKLVFERVAQDWDVTGCLVVLKISRITKSIVNFIADDLVSIDIQSVKEPVKLNEMERCMIIYFDSGRSWVSHPDNILFPINVWCNILERRRSIKTIHVIETLSIGLISNHISGSMPRWVAVASPHVKRSVVYCGSENSSKVVWLAAPWDCAFKNVDHFIIIQDAVVVSLADEGVIKLIESVCVEVAQFGLGGFLFISLQRLKWSGSNHVVNWEFVKVSSVQNDGSGQVLGLGLSINELGSVSYEGDTFLWWKG